VKRFSVLATAFVALVVLANYLASRYTVPVGFGYRAPGGVFCVGAVLVLRDWMQQLRGLRWTMPLVYLAGLQDIPRDLYEAAALDGASGARAFWAITLPLLRPVLLFVVVTHVIGSFQLFGQVFVLTGGGPGDATRTVVQHLYETAFQNFFQFGAASAMAWVLFAVILAFSLLQFRLLRGHTEY